MKSRPDVIAGPGDDCAVVAAPEQDRLLLLKTDCVVERVHFRPNEKPAAVGWKAMARALSDFAAMSGLPQFALVTLVAPAEREARWVKEIYRGLQRVADRFAVAIVGGETSAHERSGGGFDQRRRDLSRKIVGCRAQLAGKAGDRFS